MSYQQVKPLSVVEVSKIRSLTDKPLPTVPVEIVATTDKLSFLNKLQGYYHTVSVAVMGLALWLIDSAPLISPFISKDWQTGLSITVVVATIAYNFFKSNVLWVKAPPGGAESP